MTQSQLICDRIVRYQDALGFLFEVSTKIEPCQTLWIAVLRCSMSNKRKLSSSALLAATEKNPWPSPRDAELQNKVLYGTRSNSLIFVPTLPSAGLKRIGLELFHLQYNSYVHNQSEQ